MPCTELGPHKLTWTRFHFKSMAEIWALIVSNFQTVFVDVAPAVLLVLLLHAACTHNIYGLIENGVLINPLSTPFEHGK